MEAIILDVQRTPAYGLWQATAQLADGRTVAATGTTESQARYNALRRQPCATPQCPGTLGSAEALVSRASCSGAYCGACRERAFGPNTDPHDD